MKKKEEVKMNIISYPSPEETARQLAAFIADKVSKSDTYNIALTGGSSAPILYDALAASEIDWFKVHLFFACEVLTGAQRGAHYEQAHRHLISKVPLRDEQVHAFPLDAANSEEAARHYAEETASVVPHLDGLPRFDLVLLALGEDGHIAGLFPGQEELYHEEGVFLSNTTPEEQAVCTLSLKALGEAKSIVLYAFGSEVRFVIGNMVNLMPQAKAYPANMLTALHPWSILYADADAMREKSYAIY